MSESSNPNQDVLDYLRAQFARMHERFDRNESDHREIIHRIGSLERDVAGLKVDFAAMQIRLDTMSERVDRLERRLELVG